MKFSDRAGENTFGFAREKRNVECFEVWRPKERLYHGYPARASDLKGKRDRGGSRQRCEAGPSETEEKRRTRERTGCRM